jgi:hypothetical protein
MTIYRIIVISIATAFLLSGCEKPSNNVVNGKQLVVTTPCKPIENNCRIEGEGLKLKLQFKAPPSYQRLLPITVESIDNSLDELLISMIIDGKEMPAVKMDDMGDKKMWGAQLMTFAIVTKDNLNIKINLTHNAKAYFAEIPISY